MKRIWLFVVAALFALTSTTVALAAEAMPATPSASGTPMQEQKDDSMGSKMESTKMEGAKMEDKNMKGDAMKMEGQKGDMGSNMESSKMESSKMKDKKMEGKN